MKTFKFFTLVASLLVHKLLLLLSSMYLFITGFLKMLCSMLSIVRFCPSPTYDVNVILTSRN